MVLAYGMVALISLCMVGLCVGIDKKRDTWLILLFVSVSVCNLGYFMVAVSNDLSAALNANRISYLGSVFLPFFMLMMVLRFCGIRRKKSLTVTLISIGIIMLGITTSPGILPIYYSTVDIEIKDGATRLLREYGPLHLLYYVYLFGYMFSMVGVVFHSIAKKKIKTKAYTILILCTVFCNIVIWLAEQFVPRGFEWLSVSYILTECLILVIYRSMDNHQWLIEEKQLHSYTVNVLLALFLLLFASFVRIVTMETTKELYYISHMVVLMIYIGILVSWGVSIYDRIVNKKIRRYLIALVGLMMFWMLMRTLRHTVFNHFFPIGQWCWYAFYIPMILIPQLCLFASEYLGKPEDYKIPKKWNLLYIPSILLILGILTNDLHQMAFRFHLGYEVGWDIYTRTVLYYLAVVWIFACIAFMIGKIIKGCRVPGAQKTIWLPIGMVGIGVLYTILYTLDTDLFGFIEVTAALCFTVVGIWESCIKTGLIQSNTHYKQLLKYSASGIVIVDHNYNIHYRSGDATELTVQEMKEAKKEPFIREGGYRVSSSPIRGGYTVWQEDISQLLGVLCELESVKAELKDSNDVSIRNYQMDRQIRSLAEINRLHDEQARQTSTHTDLLEALLNSLDTAKSKEEKKKLLEKIVIVGAYLKRRRNLIFLSEQEGSISQREIVLSLDEMMKNLRLSGVSCAFNVNLIENIPSEVAMEMLDFYEYVVESAMGSLESLLARFFYRNGDFYVCIDAVCSLDLTALTKEGVFVEATDDNCYALSFVIKGGGKG